MAYQRVLQVSAVHVYLSYPFVLSWSLLEAMAAGTRIVASNTPPVCEVFRGGKHGTLVEFFDATDIAHKVLDAIEMIGVQDGLIQAARIEAQRYCRYGGLAGWRATTA